MDTTTVPPSNRPQARLVLAEALDLVGAEPLYQSLRQRIAGGQSLMLDGHAVERVSTPCLQILAAACAAARSRNIGFHLHDASVALASAITDLGLSAAIPLEP